MANPLKLELTYPLIDARIEKIMRDAIEGGGRVIITFPKPTQEDWDYASELEEDGDLTILYTEMAIEAAHPEG